MRRLVQFNDNTQIPGTIDRFFKVWPLFNLLATVFRSEPQTLQRQDSWQPEAIHREQAGQMGI